MPGMVPSLGVAALAGAAAATAAVAQSEPRAMQLEGLPLTLSADFDLYNQGVLVKHFEEKFYRGDMAVLSAEELTQVDTLRQHALQTPVMALAAAQVLYMFGWFRASGEIIRDNVVAAAVLFEQSIVAGGCAIETSDTGWHDNACDIRWMHATLLYNWLSETDVDANKARAYAGKAQSLFEALRTVPRYAQAAKTWHSPLHINFQAVRFPGKPSYPIWDTKSIGIGRFLEESHPVFKAELQAIINDPRGLYKQLMNLDPSREHLATPGGWDTLRIVRYHHWYDIFCEAAPRTCALIKTRPEINKCDFMNVNYVRLNPGAHLKPHFGNGPRLSAHLSVIAPEPLRAGMTVADQRALWVEGKAIVFDDTYPHCVSHWGDQPRYVMLVWFCHPCDDTQQHGQVCPS